MGTWPYWYAGVIELVVGLLLLVGLVTRLAAFVGSGEMAFAYFTQHQPQALWPIENGGELAVLFCFGFLLLVFTGGGAFALDAMRKR
jgi:putative oxidoreductase